MKRTGLVVLVIVALAVLAGLITAAVLAQAQPAQSPPELATMTPPPIGWVPTGTPTWQDTPTPGAYPPPPDATQAPEEYPANEPKAARFVGYLPVVERE